MIRKVLPVALAAGLLAPGSASAGIADDYYPVLSYLLNTVGFGCAQVSAIAGAHLGYECSLTGIQVTLKGDQCISALQNTCALAPTTATVADLVAGDLVITEIMQNPNAVGDALGEWFEVYNASGLEVDLDGLEVSDLGSDSFTVSGALVVADGAYVVFGRNDDSLTNGGVTVDYLYTGYTLGNSDDEIILGASGLTIDSVIYDGGATYPDPAGASMNLSDDTKDATSNDDGASWCEATLSYGDGDLGSPGAANEVCPLPPTYTSVDIQAIVDVECAGCHTGGGSSGGLAMDDFYTATVGVLETSSGLNYVEPFSTDLSYVWHKLSGTQADVGGTGEQMPKGSAPLPSSELDIIETWILEGAPE